MRIFCTFLPGLLVLCASLSWGQGNCQPFRGSIQATLYMDVTSNPPAIVGWVGRAAFTFGDGTTVTGNTLTINTGMKKGGPLDPASNVFLGTEKTFFAVDDANPADGFILFTRFVCPRQDDPLFGVNETGTIAPDDAFPKGRFSKVSGHYTHHGVAGPGVPADPPPAGQAWVALVGWTGEYHGSICGVK